MVPLFAYSNCPGLRRCAPVKAPFSWPKSSDSSSPCGIAAQLTLTNGSAHRIDAAWTARATRSLPTPLSPRIRTVVSVSAMLSMMERMARIGGCPSKGGRRLTKSCVLSCPSALPADPPRPTATKPSKYKVFPETRHLSFERKPEYAISHEGCHVEKYLRVKPKIIATSWNDRMVVDQGRRTR